jgi:hypothetical protein
MSTRSLAAGIVTALLLLGAVGAAGEATGEKLIVWFGWLSARLHERLGQFGQGGV